MPPFAKGGGPKGRGIFPGGELERLLATDTGVTGNWVDIYTADYGEAVQNGLQKLTVWFTPPEETE